MTTPHNNPQGTAGREQRDRHPHQIFWEDAKPEDFMNAQLMDWIQYVGDISTQYELNFIRNFGGFWGSRINHTSAHAPAFKRCCDSCINVPCKVLNRIPCLAQEKQENICEENGCTDIENCDEICQHSRLFSPLQMQEAKEQAAKAEREEVLDEVIAKLHNQMAANWTPHREGLGKAVILVESLRQPEPQQ